VNGIRSADAPVLGPGIADGRRGSLSPDERSDELVDTRDECEAMCLGTAPDKLPYALTGGIDGS
jgi:hypothetical protein